MGLGDYGRGYHIRRMDQGDQGRDIDLYMEQLGEINPNGLSELAKQILKEEVERTKRERMQREMQRERDKARDEVLSKIRNGPGNYFLLDHIGLLIGKIIIKHDNFGHITTDVDWVGNNNWRDVAMVEKDVKTDGIEEIEPEPQRELQWAEIRGITTVCVCPRCFACVPLAHMNGVSPKQEHEHYHKTVLCDWDLEED